jgi:hypothetical protein
MPTLTARRASFLAAAVLFIVYAATLAPSVTFWDAGEFIAAARTLGIPHPPGTPLFVLLLNVWARIVAFLPFAAATNSFSAIGTAAAAGLTALVVARNTRSPWAGVAAAITAGSMSSVWQNATETEVYAVALTLALAAIAAADQAGRTGERRWTLLAAYLLALAVPLHLSSIVAAPVVILLATDSCNGSRDWSSGAALVGVSACVIGVSRLSVVLTAIGAFVVLLAPYLSRASTSAEARRESGSYLGVLLIAFSALLFLFIRAHFDPAINQGNPNTVSRLTAVVARRQYDVPGMWPRQAPLWLQIANWFEYADWQFALVLAPTVIPNVWRIFATVVFAVLAAVGARWHRRRDPRTWRATALLFACGSLGVIVYLNLKAGTSFGWRFVPDEAMHEARDRDYFFVLGFWAWGIWAGLGALVAGERAALALSRRVPALAPRMFSLIIGLVLAALPIALNWAAVSRRSEPEASMPRAVANALLAPLPPNAVLFVAGDNDTYPLWYAQQVEHLRPDVAVVTLPLLGARWYADELMRRYQLAGPEPERIAAMARGMGRPVAVALTVDPDDRNRLAISWTVIGDVAVDSYSLGASHQHLRTLSVDTVAVRLAVRRIERSHAAGEPRPGTDPVHEYFAKVLSCPSWMLDPAPSKARLVSLDSICNLR